jgi:hypothetical protein
MDFIEQFFNQFDEKDSHDASLFSLWMVTTVLREKNPGDSPRG